MTVKKLWTIFITKVLTSGERPEMNYQQRRRVKMINLVGFSGGMCCTGFLVANFIEARYILVWTDLIAMIMGFSMPLFQRKGYYLYPPVIAALTFTALCSLSALLYDNHTDYFLLLFMGVSFIIWTHRWLIVSMAGLNALLFFCLQLNESPALIQPVSTWNKAIVLAISLFLYIGFLHYFKQLYTNYVAKIESQNAQLKQLNLYNEKILSVIAHDIRGPIANVHSILQMLDTKILGKEDFENLSGKLLADVSNLEFNINALLDWSKNQITKPETKAINISIREVIDRVVTFLKYQAESKNIRISILEHKQLVWHADVDQLEICVRNVLSNAIKFSYPGSEVIIHIDVCQRNGCVSVQDFGKGMTQDQLDALFIDSTLQSTHGTLNERGTGLGLKLAREFARLNGGTLTISSEPDKGTTAILAVPLAESEM